MFCNNLFYHLLALKIFVEWVVGRKESDGKITRAVLPTELWTLVIDNVIKENNTPARSLWSSVPPCISEEAPVILCVKT